MSDGLSAIIEPPNTVRRQPSASKAWLRALEAISVIGREPGRLLADAVEAEAERHPDAPALLSDRESLTYAGLAGRANLYSRWICREGFQAGQSIALLMPNRPEYMAIWLGISRMGVVVSLLNTHLTGAALAHCIDVVGPRGVIVDASLTAAFESARPHLRGEPRVWSHGDAGRNDHRIDVEIETLSASPLDADERRDISVDATALYIYTSGTTGLPKAARVSHRRILYWSYWFAGLMDTDASDRMYDCLPMYHSVGGVVATGALLARGGSVVIAETFSARRFWRDIKRWDCTLLQYIGELCRYLVNSPGDSDEISHRIRIACGNGLRDGVWQSFTSRFAIPQVLEFYASTEGNVALYNVEGRPGAIGRVPPLLAHRFPLSLVRHDAGTGEPVRGNDGLCIAADRGEIGEAIGRIATDKADTAGRFEGYTSDADSERKMLRNVFAPGDAWFRTGDLMRRDETGFYHFVDRIGDTFRWKGENVSTFEVEQMMSTVAGVEMAIVYGVTIPGHDGRAGMAALVAGAGFDAAVLREHIERELPRYARPLFLRLCRSIAATGTFKPQKQVLAAEGLESATGDVILFDDAARRAYVPLDQATLAAIMDGTIRL